MAAQAGLSLTWSKTPKTGFLATRLNFDTVILYCNTLLCSILTVTLYYVIRVSLLSFSIAVLRIFVFEFHTYLQFYFVFLHS